MLVLTRRKHQSITIGEGAHKVTLRVIHIRGGTVKLGFEAPRKVKILRDEVRRK